MSDERSPARARFVNGATIAPEVGRSPTAQARAATAMRAAILDGELRPAATELNLDEVYRLRRILEAEALRVGVPLATAADLDALRKAADACLAAGRDGDIAGQLATNRRFHDRLHGLSGSRSLSRLIDLLWDSTEACRALYYMLDDETTESDRAHRSILDALGRESPEAVITLQDAHRNRALQRLHSAL